MIGCCLLCGAFLSSQTFHMDMLDTKYLMFRKAAPAQTSLGAGGLEGQLWRPSHAMFVPRSDWFQLVKQQRGKGTTLSQKGHGSHNHQWGRVGGNPEVGHETEAWGCLGGCGTPLAKWKNSFRGSQSGIWELRSLASPACARAMTPNLLVRRSLEIGAMEKDEGEDWDDRDLKGPIPRVPKDVRTPTAK